MRQLLDVVSDEDGFDRLRDEWTELLGASDCAQPFLTWEWCRAWWRHLREDRRLHLITVREGDRLVGLAPLALRPPRLRRLQPYTQLEFLGMGAAGADYLDFVLRRGHEAPTLQTLREHLSAQERILECCRVRPAGSAARAIAGRLQAAGWDVLEEQTDTCPYLDLQGHDWDSYLRSRSGAHRNNVKRRLRKISEGRAAEFLEAGDQESRRWIYRDFVRLHHLRHGQLSGSNALHTDPLVAFHEEFTAAALDRGWLRLSLLRLDGEPAATVYGLLYNRVFYYYQAGFDPRFSDLSVGIVMLARSIRRSIEEGAREYDLLHGVERYKSLWANGQRQLVRLTLYPADPQGRALRVLAGLKARVKGMRGEFAEEHA